MDAPFWVHCCSRQVPAIGQRGNNKYGSSGLEFDFECVGAVCNYGTWKVRDDQLVAFVCVKGFHKAPSPMYHKLYMVDIKEILISVITYFTLYETLLHLDCL